MRFNVRYWVKTFVLGIPHCKSNGTIYSMGRFVWRIFNFVDCSIHIKFIKNRAAFATG